MSFKNKLFAVLDVISQAEQSPIAFLRFLLKGDFHTVRYPESEASIFVLTLNVLEIMPSYFSTECRRQVHNIEFRQILLSAIGSSKISNKISVSVARWRRKKNKKRINKKERKNKWREREIENSLCRVSNGDILWRHRWRSLK